MRQWPEFSVHPAPLHVSQLSHVNAVPLQIPSLHWSSFVHACVSLHDPPETSVHAYCEASLLHSYNSKLTKRDLRYYKTEPHLTPAVACYRSSRPISVASAVDLTGSTVVSTSIQIERCRTFIAKKSAELGYTRTQTSPLPVVAEIKCVI